MKAIVRVRISVFDTHENLPETYAEVTKEFDLPFAPFPGLKLAFTVIETGHPSEVEFQEAMNSPVLVTGICVVEDVSYVLREQEFHLKAFENASTVEELQSIVQQYVLGYGFIQDVTASSPMEGKP